MYYASLLLFSRDENGNYIKCSRAQVAGHGSRFFLLLLSLGLFKSIVMPYDDLIVFGEPIKSRSEWYSLSRYATWELYANNMIHAGMCVNVSSGKMSIHARC